MMDFTENRNFMRGIFPCWYCLNGDLLLTCGGAIKDLIIKISSSDKNRLECYFQGCSMLLKRSRLGFPLMKKLE